MAKSDTRRAVIREWMSLAREKRQSHEQALAAIRTFGASVIPRL